MNVELTRRAHRDLRRLPADERSRVLRVVADTLACEPLPPNADDKALRGREPWHRLRVGELRVAWYDKGGSRYVGRVVKRGDLERAVKTLPQP